MGIVNWLKSLVLVAKCLCGVFLQKNGSLNKLRDQDFMVFLLIVWVCYGFVTVKEVVHGEDYGLEFCGEV